MEWLLSPRKRRAIGSVVAMLVLIVIAVASGVVVYSWVSGMIGVSTPPPARTGRILIDAAKANSPFLEVFIRNDGITFSAVDRIYVYALNNSLLATGIVASGNRKAVIPAKSVESVEFILDRELRTGKYILKVSSKGGLTAPYQFDMLEALPKGSVVNVTLSNTEANKVVVDGDYAVLERWVIPDGSYWRVYINITAKVDLSWYREELFASDGEHPDWVGPWSVYEKSGSPALPAGWWDSQYWTPIRSDEFPVYIIYSLKRG